jgi:hypothetical protein
LRKDEALSISYALIIGKETWRSIESTPGVMASSMGRIMSVPYEVNGRRCVSTPSSGRWSKNTGGGRYIHTLLGKTFRVARLVCETFNGPQPPGKPVCMHLDEDSRNNLPGNLAWGTQKENLNAPKYTEFNRHRVRLFGEDNPNYKHGRKCKK